MKPNILCLVATIAAIHMVTASVEADPQTNMPVTAMLERALLREDWKVVTEQCGPTEDLARSPILRAIKGHGLMVLNRNNESLLLFLSMANEPDIQEWAGWTKVWMGQHGDQAIAHYLYGDAQARLGRWEEAAKCYTTAINTNRSCALAFNARGVALLRLGNETSALNDFKQACELAPNLADAHASLGTFWVHRQAPEGALEAYTRALALSADFSLALIGRGCAQFGEGSNDLAVLDFTKAATAPAVAKLSFYNANQVLQKELARTTNALRKADQGMFINTAQLFERQARLINNMEWNRSVMQITPWLPKVSFEGTEVFRPDAIWKNSFVNVEADRRELYAITRELANQGFNADKGGASTDELGTGNYDRKPWPVVTWFGLGQKVIWVAD